MVLDLNWIRQTSIGQGLEKRELHISGAKLGTESAAEMRENQCRDDSEIKDGVCMENMGVSQIKYPVRPWKAAMSGPDR